jgi:hypothetical protein
MNELKQPAGKLPEYFEEQRGRDGGPIIDAEFTEIKDLEDEVSSTDKGTFKLTGNWVADELIPATEAVAAEALARPIVTETISEEDFRKFTESGEISISTLQMIAGKIKDSKELTNWEKYIYNEKASEIDSLVNTTNENDSLELTIPVTVETEASENNATIKNPAEFIGQRADMAEKIQSTEAELNRDYRAQELAKIEAGVEQVVSGEKDEVTLEVSSDAFAEYGAELRARLAAAGSTYGAEKETKKLEKELAAFEKKESSILQVRESFEFVNQKLEDSTLTPETKAKLEKNKETLETITSKLEKRRQSQDREFKEKSLDWAKEKIGERWRKGKWYHKVGVGVALSMLTLGASQVLTRPLGLYASYQGIKQGRLSKLAKSIEELETSGKSEEAKITEIEKVILENSFDKKSLGGALALSAFFYGVGEAISQSGVAETVVNFVAEKSAAGISIAEQYMSGTLDSAVTPELTAADAGIVAGATGAIAEQAVASNALFEHASATVAEGDTMYSILEREFNISDKLADQGRQYNAIENILSQIKANPAEHGITSGDVDALRVGDTIDIEKIGQIVANYRVAGDNIFEHAGKLPQAVVSGIETYMPAVAKAALAEVAAHNSEVAAVITSSVVSSPDIVPVAASGETPAAVVTEVTSAEPEAELSDIAEPIAPLGANPETPGATVTYTNPDEPVNNNRAEVFMTPIDESSNPNQAEVFMTPASLSMNEAESIRSNTLLFSDFNQLGGNRSDINRFGAEPISTFIRNPPSGSEKIMSLLVGYNSSNAVLENEKGTVLQYLQRAALTKIRASKIA